MSWYRKHRQNLNLTISKEKSHEPDECHNSTGRLTVYGDQHTRGDTDFGGHGPNMWLNVAPYVANEFQLGLNVYVKFMETQSDWTTFEGHFNGIVFDIRTMGGNHKILSVASPTAAIFETLNGTVSIPTILVSEGWWGASRPLETLTEDRLGAMTTRRWLSTSTR
jgi:hypothetical protein